MKRSVRIMCPLLASALLPLSAPAYADPGRKIPNNTCPVSSPCYQSYLQGNTQTLRDWLSMDKTAPRSFENLVGSINHPEQGAAVCRNELAAANNSSNTPADPHSFLGGCHDTLLALHQD